MQSFGTLGQLLKNFPFVHPENGIVRGEGNVPKCLFERKKKKKEKIMLLIMTTMLAQLQGSAGTLLGPKEDNFMLACLHQFCSSDKPS